MSLRLSLILTVINFYFCKSQTSMSYFEWAQNIPIDSINAQQYLIASYKFKDANLCYNECCRNASCVSCTYANATLNNTFTCNLYNNHVNKNVTGQIKVNLYTKRCK